MKISARILVVDDDDHVREALVDELSVSYLVEAVASGGEAFDALSTQQYDVVISDLKMPDHDGIEVLEFARQHQRDAVRVLLTGYLDERAHRALLSPDAPYKVGKPWHDEIEVVVQRALEQRDTTRRLNASVEDALELATFDEELRRTSTPMELCETVVRRALTVEGVLACTTIARSEVGEHTFIGGQVAKDGPGWYLDLPLDADGDLRVRARGIGDGGRQLVTYLAHRAQRRCGVLEARVSSVQSAVAGGQRVNHLMRQATLGALTSSLLHDLASTVQAMSAALGDLTIAVDEHDTAMLTEAAADARAAGEEIVQLFVQMRRFIRDGEVTTKPIRIIDLVQRAGRLAGGYVRERAQLRVAELPDATVVVSEPLFLQVLANLLRNAANASPTHGIVDLKVVANDDEVVFTVIDDGPGVAPGIADQMFEAFASNTAEGTGLGLAISAYVMQLVGGRIAYRRAADRGACFTVSLPRANKRVPTTTIPPTGD
ncbi:MAG: ATP-binding protein [Proteobacteria bacterium]|nr:ATP-binding protein [Pseudomonadota bacterium]